MSPKDAARQLPVVWRPLVWSRLAQAVGLVIAVGAGVGAEIVIRGSTSQLKSTVDLVPVPLLAAGALVGGVGLIVSAWERRWYAVWRRRGEAAGYALCPRCGYDLSSVPAWGAPGAGGGADGARLAMICPECGAGVDAIRVAARWRAYLLAPVRPVVNLVDALGVRGWGR